MLNKTSELSLAIISDYCVLQNSVFNGTQVSNISKIFDPSTVSIYGLTGNMFFNDVAFQLAVDAVNNSTTILPHTRIKIRRFTDCGQYSDAKRDNYIGLSGGESVSMAIDLGENYPDIVGILGNQFSTTCKVTAEVLGQYKLPYCSSGSSTPSLSNKSNYPYFFRSFPSVGVGNHISRLLLNWSVRRVVLITQRDDDLGYAFSLDMISAFSRNGIMVVENFQLHSRLAGQLEYVVETINRISGRYLVVAGQQNFNAGIAYRLGKLGIIGSQFVFLSNMTPIPYGDPIKMFGEDFYHYIEGWISMLPVQPNISSTQFQNTFNQFREATGANITIADFNIGLTLQYSYDCVYLLLHGIHHLLNQYPDINIEQIVNQGLANYSLFQNLGYDGLSASPLTLNQFGDSEVAYEALYFTGNMEESFVFGKTSLNATDFIPSINHSTPRFYGGSNTPPPDDAEHPHPPVTVYSLDNYRGRTILLLAVFGIILSLVGVALLAHNRTHRFLRAASVPESIGILCGCVIGYVALLFYLNEPTPTYCMYRVLLNLTAYATITTLFISKSSKLLRLSRLTRRVSQREIDWIVFSTRGMWCLLMLVVIFLIIQWAKASQYNTLLGHMQDGSYLTCQATNSLHVLTTFVVMLFCILICLLPTMALFLKQLQNLHTSYDESLLLIIIFIVTCLIVLLFYTMGTSESSDFNSAVILWLFWSMTQLLYMGPKAIYLVGEAISKQNNSQVQKLLIRVADTQGQTTTQSVGKRSLLSNGRNNWLVKLSETNHWKSGSQQEVLSITSSPSTHSKVRIERSIVHAQLVYRVSTKCWLYCWCFNFLQKWRHGQAEMQISGNQMWFSVYYCLDNIAGIHCMKLSGYGIKLCGNKNKVTIICEAFLLECEFQNCVEAEKFITDFHSAKNISTVLKISESVINTPQ
ncbi:periplasmic binding protein-like I [Rhizoclosmatium globosum]|uniref:Periplasmic binding protein-like I n=1 Tax=Rhizoclosmatium globosum TaxID=329046 RepID=A0A1Y2CW51_9FUNG|nr:periplasmic binding protein-like I [Rhizoclosmatium globosum]|eukprot:ORY51258.1 periplasmic binding protein-like I [Rhizoclosmatium globosum]